MAVKIFGYKPSEIRKGIVAIAAAVGVLAAGILSVATGAPVVVLAVLASVIAGAGAVGTILTENKVAAAIDSVDNL